jgi:hypothetical protein
LTCTFSFALALLQQRRLPMLQELVLIVHSIDLRDLYPSKQNSLGRITDLIMESSDTHTPMRRISIPIWTPWESLFKVAKILSRSNDVGANSMLFLPSLPHYRLLFPLVETLNGNPVTKRPHFPTYISEKSCMYEGVCFECHNGGWTCADVKRCRRGRRGELVAITRYTLSS